MSLFGNRSQGRRRVPEARPTHAARSHKGVSISTAITVIVMVAGVGIIAYPTFSDWWNSYHQSRAISSYVKAVERTDPETIERMLGEARAYNESLALNGFSLTLSDEQREEYKSLLNLDGTGVMGYIQIERLGIDYPIYHGVDEAALQVAIGHLEGTSLPVGGQSTHAVVTGHRGLPRAKLFTNIDQMREGDTFTITVLSETLIYEVDQIRIVDPEDLHDLVVIPKADYVTLVTCTPYGINTHRLLVRGHRIENQPSTRAIPAEAVLIPPYVSVPAVGIPMLFIHLLGSLVGYHLADRKPSKWRALRALEKTEGGERHGHVRKT